MLDMKEAGAVFFSSDNTADTVLYISGNVRFGDGVDRGGQDGIFLGTNSSGQYASHNADQFFLTVSDPHLCGLCGRPRHCGGL